MEINNLFSVKNKVAVVTGGSRGIGEMITAGFLANGAKVTFDGNFKTETGQAYSGVVSVIMKHLDPSDATTVDKMPGMLLAQNSNGEERVLESYGMMNIELRGAASQKLQLSTTAQIEMPISTSQLASAPATIPLWHFDETLGYWKEEGSATKQGTKYIGTVSHFSWWNCDAQFPTVIAMQLNKEIIFCLDFYQVFLVDTLYIDCGQYINCSYYPRQAMFRFTNKEII